MRNRSARPSGTTLADPDRLVKSQTVRLLDVYVIGPLIGTGGYLLLRSNPVFAWALIVTGWGTSAYNAYNYRRYKELGRQ